MLQTSGKNADVIIIGGGLFGCAIAYYYTRNNADKKVIVLERNTLCSAATSRAAALITKIREKKHFIPLSLETYKVIPQLEQLLGESMHVKYSGVMHVASSPQRINELDILMQTAAAFNEPATYITATQAAQLSPWLNADEIEKAAFIPGEAYCDPYLLGSFFGRAAAKQGAVIKQGVEVFNLLTDKNVAIGVECSEGKLYADKVIIASGAWAPVLALKAGIGLPLAPVRSQYWITERHNIFPANSPIVILPDVQAYARPESGGLLFGIREKKSFYTSPDKIPADISNFLFSPDKGMHDLSEVIQQLARFFPLAYDIGLKYYIAGFSAYTPDNNLSMGVSTSVNNLLLATGCVGAGVSVCGGVGLAFAQLAADKPNPFDFSQFSIERFGNIHPFDEAWLQRCAAARAIKSSG
jgi:4-methylaminobutanoate oxidase (formaldehyde-forming)